MRTISLAPPGMSPHGLSSLDMTFPRNGRAVGYAVAAPTSWPELSQVKDTCILTIDDASLVVSIAAIDTSASECRMTLVAGKNGITDQQPARALDTGLSFGDVVQYMVEQAGESLDVKASDPELMGLRVPYWQIDAKASTATQLNRLCAVYDARWTFTNDGNVVIMNTTFADVVLPRASTAVATVDWTQSMTFVVSHFDVLPVSGQIYNMAFAEVQLLLSAKSSLVRLCPQSTTDRFVTSALSTVRDESFYNRRFLATVVSQNSDGTLKVQPDDDDISGSGIDHVLIRYGVPGARATSVAQGTRVILEYCSADPSVIYASSFLQEDGSDFLLTIGRPNAAQFVALSNLVDDRLDQIRQFINTQMVIATPVGPSSPGVVTPLPPLVSVAATKLKVQ